MERSIEIRCLWRPPATKDRKAWDEHLKEERGGGRQKTSKRIQVTNVIKLFSSPLMLRQNRLQD
jgi:hypothetical protein